MPVTIATVETPSSAAATRAAHLSLVEPRLAPAAFVPHDDAPWQAAPHNPLLHLPQPLWLLRGGGRLLMANAAAAALKVHWQLGADGQLLRLGSVAEAQLAALLRLAAAGSPSHLPLWLPPRLATAHLSLQALAPALRLAWAAPADTVLLSLQVDDAGAQQRARLEALATQATLTSAERCVLLLLADGQSPEAAALQLGVRLSTLRSHVRHLLAKTGTHSLLQLLRWIGSAAPQP